MKVTRQSEPRFIPVVITLENQEEVDILWDLLGHVSGTGAGRKFCSALYSELYGCQRQSAGCYFSKNIPTNPY